MKRLSESSPPSESSSRIRIEFETNRFFSDRRYLGSMPNTYTFSKRLAEQVIDDYSKDLPCVIFRPSIGN